MLLIASLILILFGFIGLGTEVNNYSSGMTEFWKFLKNLILALLFLSNGLILLRLNFKKTRFSFFSKKGFLYMFGFFLSSFGIYGFSSGFNKDLSNGIPIDFFLGFGLIFIGGILIYIANNQEEKENKSWTNTIFSKQKIQCSGCGAKNKSDSIECEYCGSPL